MSQRCRTLTRTVHASLRGSQWNHTLVGLVRVRATSLQGWESHSTDITAQQGDVLRIIEHRLRRTRGERHQVCGP